MQHRGYRQYQLSALPFERKVTDDGASVSTLTMRNLASAGSGAFWLQRIKIPPEEANFFCLKPTLIQPVSTLVRKKKKVICFIQSN